MEHRVVSARNERVEHQLRALVGNDELGVLGASDPHAGSDVRRAARRDRTPDRLSALCTTARNGDIDDGELLAAHASDQGPTSGGRRDQPGAPHQHPVTDSVALGVVDLLEPVKVDNNHHHRVLARRCTGGKQITEVQVKAATIQQTCQRIDRRLVGVVA